MSDRLSVLSAMLRAKQSTATPRPVVIHAAIPAKTGAKDYLRVAEAAGLCGVHPKTILKWGREKGLRICRPGGRIAVIRKVDLDDFLLRDAALTANTGVSK